MVTRDFYSQHKPPRFSFDFLWADHLELLCLNNADQYVSKKTLYDLMREAEDVQSDEETFDEEVDLVHDDIHYDSSAELRWNDVKSRLTIRQRSFGVWPFQLINDRLECIFDAENKLHLLYVFLLMASSLRLYGKSDVRNITTLFEDVSYAWLQNSVNPSWEVRHFGANHAELKSYNGTLYEKFSCLSKDIQAKHIKDRNGYNIKNHGDGGVDLVAWQHFGDARGNIPIIFAQCACSPKDWEHKQLDVSPPAIESHLIPQHPGASYCFVPHDFYKSEKTWQRSEHVKRIVLVDRYRIMHSFYNENRAEMLPDLSCIQSLISGLSPDS